GEWKGIEYEVFMVCIYELHGYKCAEIPMGGRKFTRVSNDGMKFSMLGRLLLNDDFNNTWGNFSVIALDMKLLDHYIGTESFTFEYLVFLEQFWKRHEKQSILEQKRRKMHSDQRKDTKYAHLAIRRIKLLPNMSNKSPYSRVDAEGDKEKACSGCIISEGDLFMTVVSVVTYSHVDSSLRALAGQAEGFGRQAVGGLHGEILMLPRY
ncbi:hypothetical protein Tco_0001359, partial [Tanacetum coccineum]